MPIDLARLMGGARAAMAFLDPPYNVRVRDIVGRGRVKHPEFAMASGELSRSDFVGFLKSTLAQAAAVSRDGAVHYVCMDWRHIGELIEAGGMVYGEMLEPRGVGEVERRPGLVLPQPARTGRRLPCRRGSHISTTSSWGATAAHGRTSGTTPGSTRFGRAAWTSSSRIRPSSRWRWSRMR